MERSRRCALLIASLAVLSISAFLVAKLAAQVPGAALPDTGKGIYEARCAQCHGVSGKGDGPASSNLHPRPRDFTSGKFKIRSTATGSLPTDDDLIHSIMNGLPGTAMPAWRSLLNDDAAKKVLVYIKSFSPRFAGEMPQSIVNGNGVPTSPESIARGQQQYERLKCGSCHGTNGTGAGAIAGPLKDDWDRPIAASRLTEPWTFRGGPLAQDVFTRLKTGMNGTPMPSFSGSAVDPELWDLANYVVSLARKPVWSMSASEIADLYATEAKSAKENPVDRGAYLVRTLGCPYCHTPVREDGSQIEELYLSGGQRWGYGPYGSMFSANLTADKETGIGNVSDAQLKEAITRGVKRDGTRMMPLPMPWTSYASLNGDDLNAVIAFLRTLPAVSNKVPPREWPNIFSYLAGKFQMLILKHDFPVAVFPGNAGSHPVTGGAR